MRQFVKSGMAAGLVAVGSAAANGQGTTDSEDHSTTDGRRYPASRIVTLDQDGRSKIILLDEEGQTKLDITAGAGNSHVVVWRGSGIDTVESTGKEAAKSAASAVLDQDCLNILQELTDRAKAGAGSVVLTDDENSVLEEFCMMSNSGICRLNAAKNCGG